MKILGIDYGDKRIGLAISDDKKNFSFPLEVIDRSKVKAIFRIKDLIKENNIDTIVIGKPIRLSGESEIQVEKIEKFSKKLKEKIKKIDIIYQDERYSTFEARKYLKFSGKDDKFIKDNIDMYAAQIILKTYLEKIKKMEEKMRKTIIAGNWKMNKTRKETREFFENLEKNIQSDKAEVIIAAPYTLLETAVNVTKNDKIKISAENMNENDKGAYTGEISADMLLDLDVKYTLLGHSERRNYYNETDEKINLKAKKALEKGITPIICIGESLEERENSLTEKVLKEQIEKAYKDISKEEVKKTVVAYEPIWAIGTGKTASPEMAQETHQYVREVLNNLYGEVSEEIRILYGGSMNDKNASELLAQKDIDGGLIGGASLTYETFSTIINMVK